jgi:hypothetical protein
VASSGHQPELEQPARQTEVRDWLYVVVVVVMVVMVVVVVGVVGVVVVVVVVLVK